MRDPWIASPPKSARNHDEDSSQHGQSRITVRGLTNYDLVRGSLPSITM